MNPPSRWTGLRDFFAAIREMLVILAILSFFLMPGRMKQFLYDLDIRSIAGIEFNWEKYQQAKQDIQFAQQEMQEIQSQLDLAQQALSQQPSSQQLLAQPSINQNGGWDRPTGGNGGSPAGTVNVPELVNIIDSASRRSRDIGNRLNRAEQNLVPPSELFHQGADRENQRSRR